MGGKNPQARKHECVGRRVGGHQIKETLLWRKPSRNADFGTPRCAAQDGGPRNAPSPRQGADSGIGILGKQKKQSRGRTPRSPSPRRQSSPRRGCLYCRPGCRGWQRGRTAPAPRKEVREGGTWWALPAARHRTAPRRVAPPQRHSPRRAERSRSEPYRTAVRARRGGRRCRGGGSRGGRRWRANRGPARRRESPAAAQGGRAAGIRAPRGHPPPVHVSVSLLSSSPLRPPRLPACPPARPPSFRPSGTAMRSERQRGDPSATAAADSGGPGSGAGRRAVPGCWALCLLLALSCLRAAADGECGARGDWGAHRGAAPAAALGNNFFYYPFLFYFLLFSRLSGCLPMVLWGSRALLRDRPGGPGLPGGTGGCYVRGLLHHPSCRGRHRLPRRASGGRCPAQSR